MHILHFIAFWFIINILFNWYLQSAIFISNTYHGLTEPHAKLISITDIIWNILIKHTITWEKLIYIFISILYFLHPCYIIIMAYFFFSSSETLITFGCHAYTFNHVHDDSQVIYDFCAMVSTKVLAIYSYWGFLCVQVI